MPLKYERVGSEEGNFKIKRKPRNFRMEQEVTPTWKPISGMEERAKSKKNKNKKKTTNSRWYRASKIYSGEEVL